jgi:HEAT repeat protein
MPIAARAFCLFGALLLSNLSLTSCVVSTDYADLAPEQALPHLRAVLKDPNPELRRTAAQSLGKIARKEAVPALVDALCDPDAGVRRHAVWALGMIGEDSVGPDRSPLSALLFDPDPGVREAAAMALGLTGDTQTGIELLLDRLQEPATPADAKRLAAASFGGMEARTAVPFLTWLLADPDAQVRRWAVAALGEIADQKTVAPLSKVLTKDRDPGVRIEAAFRLGKFGGEAARPALTAALKDVNADVRRLANAALKELAGGSPS